MLRLLSALTAHFEEARNEVIYNIRDMHSSDSGFAVPDRCSACVDLHLPPHSPLGEIMAEIEAIAAEVVPEPAEEVQTLVFQAIHSGYALPESGPLVSHLREVFAAGGRDWSPRPFRSHSDANLLWSAGVRPVIFGPGRLAEAHTRTESVPLAEVEEAARTLSALLAVFAAD
jgi:acetylornithine deacetylase